MGPKMAMVLLFASFALFVSKARACGMVTHQLIAHRAVRNVLSPHYPWVGDLLKHNQGAWLAGAPFPDYLYTCGPRHGDGEWWHWSQAQAFAAEYIRNQTKPWGAATEAVVAFMFGVQSHFIADLNWHGLAESPHGYGFIETVGVADFGCRGNLCSVAHTASDTGGEFVAAWQTNLSSFLDPLAWHVPVDALVAIMRLAGLNTTGASAAIEECELVFGAGSLAVEDLSELLFHHETDKAPHLVEAYASFPFGGIDDMAVWTGRMANRFFDWVQNGVPTPVPPPVPLRPRAARTQAYFDLIDRLAPAVRATPAFHEWERSRKEGRVLSADARAVIRAAVRRQVRYAIRDVVPAPAPRKSIARRSTAGEDLTPPVTSWVQGKNPLNYAGQAMVSGDFNGDGVPDLAWSAYGVSPSPARPQRGAVFVAFGVKGETLSVDNASNVVALPLPDLPYARFGFALVRCDLNGDGVHDLAVGAPVAGWGGADAWDRILESPAYNYFGQVHVFFGNRSWTMGRAPADVVISSQTQMESFGLVLGSTPLGSLLVGAPMSRGSADPRAGVQAGRVRIFRSSRAQPSKHWPSGLVIADTDADQTLDGPDGNFAWFGHSLLVTKVQPNITLLVIGAPLTRLPGSAGANSAVGGVHAYRLLSGDVCAPSPVFSLRGDPSTPRGKLGFALSDGFPLGGQEPYLAISAPSADTNTSTWFAGAPLAGRVFVLRLDLGTLRGNLSLARGGVTAYAELRSGYHGSRLGWTLSFADMNGDGADELLLGAPLLTDLFDAHGHQSGAVWIVPGGAAFPRGVRDHASVGATVLGGRSKWGRFGSSLVAVLHQGGAEASLGASLCVGEPLAGPEMHGRVLVYGKGPFTGEG